jgi:hypothetical protein
VVRGSTSQAAFALALLTGCQQAQPSHTVDAALAPGASPAAALATPATVRTLVDDALVTASAVNHFAYTGHWEHVVSHRDGRALGTSSRSFHAGDVAALRFSGMRVRIYGVLGAKGGLCSVTLDGRAAGAALDFYAPRVRTGTLVYTSPLMPSGAHTLLLRATGRHDARSSGAYVNLDYAAVTSTLEDTSS